VRPAHTPNKGKGSISRKTVVGEQMTALYIAMLQESSGLTSDSGCDGDRE
jgi:hypothetical protein